jgi:hypothetical protein
MMINNQLLTMMILEKLQPRHQRRAKILNKLQSKPQRKSGHGRKMNTTLMTVITITMA